MRLLIIEDSRNLAHSLKQGLTKGAFAADVGPDPSKRRAALAVSQYAAVVLDLDLADGSAHPFSRIYASELSKKRPSGFQRNASCATRSNDYRRRRQLRKWGPTVQMKIVRGVPYFLSEDE